MSTVGVGAGLGLDGTPDLGRGGTNGNITGGGASPIPPLPEMGHMPWSEDPPGAGAGGAFELTGSPLSYG